jgi:septal ring factor EnvC (AmiA/AmiB activator)
MNQILLLLGLKTGGFSAGLQQATAESKQFGKGWNDMKKLFAAGGLLTTALYFFRSVVTSAQETRNELDKMGQPIPNHIRSVAAFADGIDQVKTASLSAAAYVVSGWTQIGEAIGYAINLARGYNEATQNNIASTEKAAAAAEARLAQAKKDNSPEKIKEAEDNLAKARRAHAMESATDEGKLNLLLAENIKLRQEVNTTGEHSINGAKAREALEKNITEIIRQTAVIKKQENEETKKAFDEDLKWYKEQAAAEKKHQEYLFEQKSVEEQIAALQQRAAVLKKEAVGDAVKQVELDQVTTDLKTKQAVLAERIAEAAAAARKAAEGQAEAARMTQKAYESIMFSITNGGHDSAQIQDSSDSALQELKRRNQGTLQGLQSDPGSAFRYGNSLEMLRLQNENARIQRELDTRNSLRSSVNFLGVEGARRQFSGDPLVFDRLVEQFAKTQTETGTTNLLLRDLITRIGPDQPGNLPATVDSLSDTMRRGLQSLGENIKDLRR